MYASLVLAMVAVSAPAPAARAVECREACRSCREEGQLRAVVDVYCTMCIECKERIKNKIMQHVDPSPPALNNRPNNFDNEINLQYKPEDYIALFETEDAKHTTRNFYPLADTEEDLQAVFKNPRAKNKAIRTAPEDEIPEGCPTPPPCSDTEDEHAATNIIPLTIKTTITTINTTTTTTTTTTATPPVCPPLKPCKKKTQHLPTPCPPIQQCGGCPMVPLCSYPYGLPQPPPPLLPPPYPGVLPPWSYQTPTPTTSVNTTPTQTSVSKGETDQVTSDTTPKPQSNDTVDYMYVYVGLPTNVL